MVFGSLGDEAPQHRMINDMENAQSGKCSHLFCFCVFDRIKLKLLLKIAVTIQLRFYKTFLCVSIFSRLFSTVCDRAIIVFFFKRLLLRVVG